jgi:hypothetical protein
MRANLDKRLKKLEAMRAAELLAAKTGEGGNRRRITVQEFRELMRIHSGLDGDEGGRPLDASSTRRLMPLMESFHEMMRSASEEADPGEAGVTDRGEPQ